MIRLSDISQSMKIMLESRNFRVLFVLSTICAICFYSYPGIHSFIFSEPVEVHVASRSQYSVVFDAGSTGSRVHIFHFRIEDNVGVLPRLVSETYHYLKPGLSFYKHPDQAAASLKPLLSKAKLAVPEKYRRNTPLLLKATAGLRLLPGNAAQDILNRVHDFFVRDRSFKVENSSCEILDGVYEGVYAWTTINYALDNLRSGENVAVIDLGGGSAQITFRVLDKNAFHNLPKDHGYTFSLFDEAIYLSTHSYLGVGLMEARLAVLLGTTFDGNSTSTHTIHSSCFPLNFSLSWEWTGINRTIVGTSRDKSDVFSMCQSMVVSAVSAMNILKPDQLSMLDVFPISYYPERAQDAEILPKHQNGDVPVSKFLDYAKRICTEVPRDRHGFLCLDLLYMYHLLVDGFGLKTDKLVKLRQKVNDIELSWALGAGLDSLD